MTEIALALAAAGTLLGIAALASRLPGRWGIPLALLFLAVGMLAGSEGIGGIPFEDHGLALQAGTAALVVILFDGGLNTSAASLRGVLRPAGLLATAGVLLTAALTAAAARLLGWPWPLAWVLGAVVSSTDAAAVFAVLRTARVNLRRRVAATVEAESGLNDPMAFLLTAAFTSAAVAGQPPGPRMLLDAAVQGAIGAAGGWAAGRLGRFALSRATLAATGLYPVLLVAVAFAAFGIPTLLGGSGLLAVYIAGIVLGDGPLPHRASLLRVFDALAWFGQVAMFLVLGLLVFPSRLPAVAGEGLFLALWLAVVARPLAVVACLLPFRLPWREVAFVAAVGLRGAVPIILATVPVLAALPGGDRIFHAVFFVVAVGTIVPGALVPWLARRLGLEAPGAPSPPAVLEIDSRVPLKGEVTSYLVRPALATCGARLAEVPFPPGAAVMLVVRGGEMIAPRGDTRLVEGDHVYIVADPADRPVLLLLFGGLEGE